MPKKEEISIDTLYFIALFLISLASLFNGGFGSFFSILGSGIFAYIVIKIIFKYLESVK
jgi:hypothetical protein